MIKSHKKQNLSFMFFCFAVTAINTTISPMKRTIDAVASCADIVRSLCEIPEDLLPRLLSPYRKSALILVCKQWARLFSFSNWKTILSTQPDMLTRHPRDCERIYYRLIRDNDLVTMKTLLTADAQCQEHVQGLLKDQPCSFVMRDLSEEMRQLLTSYMTIDTLSAVTIATLREVKGDVPYDDDEFVKSIFYNDIEGMKKYLQRATPSRQLIDLRESIDIVARYVSIPMLEILKPILEEDMELEEEQIAAQAQDWLVAKAAIKCNGHRVEIVEHLLSGGARDGYDWDGESIIVGAVILAHEKNDYSLLDLCARYRIGVNFNQQGDKRMPYKRIWLSALEWAVVKNNTCLVHILLHLGADPDAALQYTIVIHDVKFSDSLSDVAQELGNPEIIRALKFASMKKNKD